MYHEHARWPRNVAVSCFGAESRPDVTLSCNGGRKFLAHRRVLSEAGDAAAETVGGSILPETILYPKAAAHKGLSEIDRPL